MTSIHENPQGETAPQPTVTEARQGITTRHIRWILGVSLSLACAAMVAAWAFVTIGH